MAERILVTGAAGFAGRHLVAALLRETPAPAVVAWRRPGGSAAGAHRGAGPPRPPGGRTAAADDAAPGDRRRRSAPAAGGAEADPAADGPAWRDVDLLDAAAVADALAEAAPQQVFHCGGLADAAGSWRDRAAALRTNVLGAEHLFEAVRRAAPGARVLVTGSAAVYRPKDGPLDEDDPVGPISPYGVSKLAQEMLAVRAAADGLDVVITRAFTHIGPGQTPAYAASSFARQIAAIEAGRAAPELRVGALDARRDLTDVRDTVRAYRALAARGAPGARYNVCSGRAIRMRDLLDRLLQAARVPIAVRLDPARLRPDDYPLLVGTPARLAAATGWTPRIPLDTTLRDLLDDWRAYWRAPGR